MHPSGLSTRFLLIFFGLEFALAAAVTALGQSWWVFAALSAVLFGLLWLYDNWRRVEPIHIIGLGLLLALIGVGWQIFKPATTAALTGGLESKIDAIQSAFDKYVKPRELTEEQITEIEKFLLQRPKQKFRVVYEPNNNEALKYANQLARAFERAHWEPALTATVSDKNLAEGLSIHAKVPQGTPGGSASGGVIADDVRRALAAAKVPLISSGSGQEANTQELYVLISVGHKPRR